MAKATAWRRIAAKIIINLHRESIGSMKSVSIKAAAAGNAMTMACVMS